VIVISSDDVAIEAYFSFKLNASAELSLLFYAIYDNISRFLLISFIELENKPWESPSSINSYAAPESSPVLSLSYSSN